METIRFIFSTLATVLSIYSLLCTIRIILTWIPGVSYNVTSFFSKICDPYLNYFSKRGWLRFGAIDFSPFLSLGILTVLTTLCNSIAQTGFLSFALILALFIQMIWNVISSILGFFLIFLIVRFIFLLIQNNSYGASNIWRQIDYVINPIVYKIANTFSHGRMISYKTAILVSIISIFFSYLGGIFIINAILRLIQYIPF